MAPLVDVDGALTRTFDALVARLGVALPGRRYVTVGDVALDCNAFCVSAVGVVSGSPADEGSSAAPPFLGYQAWTVNMEAVWTICIGIPQNGVPTAASLNDSGHRSAVMASALLSAAIDARDAGEIMTECGVTSLGPVSMIGPEGGVFGVVLPIAMQVI